MTITAILASDWLAGVRAVAAQHPAPQAHAGVHQRDEAQLRPQQLGDGRVRQPGAGSGLTCDGSLALIQGFSHETCAIYDAVLQCMQCSVTSVSWRPIPQELVLQTIHALVSQLVFTIKEKVPT